MDSCVQFFAAYLDVDHGDLAESERPCPPCLAQCHGLFGFGQRLVELVEVAEDQCRLARQGSRVEGAEPGVLCVWGGFQVALGGFEPVGPGPSAYALD